eukprot:snap_masked-scaffold_1-processed-gene-4.53-mRNA-1 protein AED:1.00 eAED:1.00 QI:0/0/0/0/1/1/2/0/79
MSREYCLPGIEGFKQCNGGNQPMLKILNLLYVLLDSPIELSSWKVIHNHQGLYASSIRAGEVNFTEHKVSTYCALNSNR